jgi:alcohol dehydrogenase class IV
VKQIIISGEDSFNLLFNYLSENAVKRIFLVRGRESFFRNGASDYFLEIEEKFTVYHFFDFSVNPKIEDVERGVQEFNKFNSDIIIAIGGGSVIDMAKLINLDYPQTSKAEFLKNSNLITSRQKIVAIPTTAGTGSESTEFAVVYIDHVKFSVAGKDILPRVVLLEPELTDCLSPYLTAVTGLDALAQAIESYWSVNSTRESLILSERAITLLITNLPLAVRNGTNNGYRKDLLQAANLAGQAINITKTTAPHAISYSFTSYFGIPHGHAVALTLPFFFEYNFELSKEDCNDPRGATFVKKSLLDLASILGCDGVYDASRYLQKFISDIGVEIKLDNLNISLTDIRSYVLPNINNERLFNNPRALHENWFLEWVQ